MFEYLYRALHSNLGDALGWANLVVRETDPEDASRSIATLTPQGWLVFSFLNRYELPSA